MGNGLATGLAHNTNEIAGHLLMNLLAETAPILVMQALLFFSIITLAIVISKQEREFRNMAQAINKLTPEALIELFDRLEYLLDNSVPVTPEQWAEKLAEIEALKAEISKWASPELLAKFSHLAEKVALAVPPLTPPVEPTPVEPEPVAPPVEEPVSGPTDPSTGEPDAPEDTSEKP